MTAQRTAHRLVAEAVRDGRLRPVLSLQCVDCGKAAHHYDHRDYSRPLDVEPVCRSCNKKRGTAIGFDASKSGRKVFPIHLRERQFAAIERAAVAEGKAVSTFMREAALAAAEAGRVFL